MRSSLTMCVNIETISHEEDEHLTVVEGEDDVGFLMQYFC